MPITILDGPVGTELLARGVPTPLPGWSAHAIEDAPETLAAIHRDYAGAGATVHTACTFRTKRRVFPDRWEMLARRAVEIARSAVPVGHRIAGSVAPLEDCYRPDLSPPDPQPEHAQLAATLADAGADLLLCETFPHVDEALAAARACLATGLETWVSVTAGPDADLLSPAPVAEGARRAVDAGVAAILVNCIPAAQTLPFVDAIAGCGVPVGAYANAGRPDERMGWASIPEAPARYAQEAQRWVDAGATIIGGCCGTGLAHTLEVARRFTGFNGG